MSYEKIIAGLQLIIPNIGDNLTNVNLAVFSFNISQFHFVVSTPPNFIIIVNPTATQNMKGKNLIKDIILFWILPNFADKPADITIQTVIIKAIISTIHHYVSQPNASWIYIIT